jgi:ankyrin repeat protein
LLLNNGADVNAVDEYQSLTPLHYAVTRDDSVMVNFLLERGADIEARDKNGWTARDYIVRWKQIRFERWKDSIDWS